MRKDDGDQLNHGDQPPSTKESEEGGERVDKEDGAFYCLRCTGLIWGRHMLSLLPLIGRRVVDKLINQLCPRRDTGVCNAQEVLWNSILRCLTICNAYFVSFYHLLVMFINTCVFSVWVQFILQALEECEKKWRYQQRFCCKLISMPKPKRGTEA